MKRYIIILLMFCSQLAKAQQQILDTLNNEKTANKSETLSNLYLAISSSVTQTDGGINFKATPFGIMVALKRLSDSDRDYLNHQFLRNFQINSSIKPKENSLFSFGSGSFGFTLSVINKSDKALTNYFSIINTFSDITTVLNTAIQSFINKKPAANQTAELIKIQTQILKFNNTQKLSDLDPSFIAELGVLINGKKVDDFLLADQQAVKALMRRVSNGTLLTLSPEINYDLNLKMTNSISYKVDWQKGLDNNVKNNPIHLQLSSSLKTARDSLKLGKNLDDVSLINTIGCNFVLREDKSQKSILELKPFVEYTHLLNSKERELDKKINTYKANLTLRLRLGENTWLPLTVKYDFEKPKLLGFLTIFWNVK
ncbi:MAG: hypothetical protein JWN56_1498 [Sphingobacteriales bacterium]|nr:hypothetical protein [Sphingobacteriales bacterium]